MTGGSKSVAMVIVMLSVVAIAAKVAVVAGCL